VSNATVNKRHLEMNTDLDNAQVMIYSGQTRL
jgi:hypothetical protein